MTVTTVFAKLRWLNSYPEFHENPTNILIQGCTNFQEQWKAPQHSRCHHSKFSCDGDLCLVLVHPWFSH